MRMVLGLSKYLTANQNLNTSGLLSARSARPSSTSAMQCRTPWTQARSPPPQLTAPGKQVTPYAPGLRVPWTRMNKQRLSQHHPFLWVRIRLGKDFLPQMLLISRKFKKCKAAGLEESRKYGGRSFFSSTFSGLQLCQEHLRVSLQRNKSCSNRTANDQSTDTLHRPHFNSFTRSAELEVPPHHWKTTMASLKPHTPPLHPGTSSSSLKIKPLDRSTQPFLSPPSMHLT